MALIGFVIRSWQLVQNEQYLVGMEKFSLPNDNIGLRRRWPSSNPKILARLGNNIFSCYVGIDQVDY